MREYFDELRSTLNVIRGKGERLPVSDYLRDTSQLLALFNGKEEGDILKLAIKLVKRELGLHLVWSTKPVVIAQQVWAALCIAQILHALRFEVARRAAVEVFDVSLPLLVRWMPRFAAQGEDPITVFVERGRAAGFIRPSRRVVHQAPGIAWSAMRPFTAGITLERTPRYAQRKCSPRKGKGH